MDCEKFDKVVLDLLYDELDELTSAAAKRHVEHCSRCNGIEAGLRATRSIGVLPLFAPPDDLGQRIIAAERRAKQNLSFRERFGRAISVMAGYAMRPQLGMAALLLLMIGASLWFLRAKPGDLDSVHVTERGVPEVEAENHTVIPLGARAAPSSAAHGIAAADREDKAKPEQAADEATEDEAKAETTPADASNYEQALAAYRAGQYAEAQKRFDEVANAGGADSPAAALYAARAARNGSGCTEAAPKFDEVNARYAGTETANEAAWQAADCYRSLGQIERARRGYEALKDVPGYSGRASEALAQLDSSQEAVATRAARAKPSPPAKASKPKSPTSEPAPQPNPGAASPNSAEEPGL